MHGTITIERPRIKVGYLMLTDGLRVRCISSNIMGEHGINRHNQWAWIVGMMVDEFNCEPEDVSCVETADGDKIAVKGTIVGELVIE